MKFTAAAFSAFLGVAGVTAFTTQKPTSAFLGISSSKPLVSKNSNGLKQPQHAALCGCALCIARRQNHPSGCTCGSCRTFLFSTAVQATTEDEPTATATAADVPEEVEAMDGINSEEEAHNAERPARKSLKKKGPKGLPLSEFSVGQSVKARVKTLTSYGAFLDIGAETDGLLHISNLSVDYVSDVNEVLEVGSEYDVRITGINENKKQVALTLLTEEQEEQATANAQQRPAKRDQPQREQRRDDTAVLASLSEKGWNTEQFVTGKVVKIVDFGAFVRVDASQLNESVEGEMDGLVHISALAPNRVNSVASIVSENESVQVRVKSIDNRKVSLTMVSVEDEQAKMEARGGMAEPEGAKDWKESLEKMQADMPSFKNTPLIVDTRNNA